MKAMTSKAEQGFSLINGMISLAVIGLIFGSVVPTMANMAQKSRAQAEFSEFARAINLARSEAITRNQIIQVSAVDEEWTNGLTIWADANDDKIIDITEVLHELPALVTNAEIKEASGTSSFSYTRMGTAKASSNAAISFHYQAEGTCDHDRKIRVSHTGRVTVKAAECS